MTEARPPPRPAEHAHARPKRPVRRLKVVVRGLPAGVDAGLALERIARAANGGSGGDDDDDDKGAAVRWMRLWPASDK